MSYVNSPLPASSPMQEQALDIIHEVLRGSAPETLDARERLWGHVAATPGQPELALLTHLMESAQLNNA